MLKKNIQKKAISFGSSKVYEGNKLKTEASF
jgi:hypothetical protein